MDAQHVLTASVLDIVFDGRNKEYGAYVLRKEYDKRLYTALISTGLLVLLMVILFNSGSETIIKVPIINPIVELDRVPVIEKPKIPEQHAKPARPVSQPRIRTIRNMTPVIVLDPPREEMPPENNLMGKAVTGDITHDGADARSIQASAQGTEDGVAIAVKRLPLKLIFF
jgi:protein TonB